jgi:hypothetical protein
MREGTAEAAAVVPEPRPLPLPDQARLRGCRCRRRGGLEGTQAPEAFSVRLRRPPADRPAPPRAREVWDHRSPFFQRADGDLALAKSDRPGLRVLFVGNSFTYYNEMPAMVHDLPRATPVPDPSSPSSPLPPTCHSARPRAMLVLGDPIEDVPWDTVVLQDRSAYLSYSREWWAGETLPVCRVPPPGDRDRGAQAMFFMTWGP